MHLEDRIKNGMTFYEHGHTDPIDIEQEKELEAQRRHCKEVMFDYNNTRPSENVKKKEILKGILGHCTDPVSYTHLDVYKRQIVIIAITIQ